MGHLAGMVLVAFNSEQAGLPFSGMHKMEGFIDFVQSHVVGDKLIHLQLLGQVILHQLGHSIPGLEPCGDTNHMTT